MFRLPDRPRAIGLWGLPAAAQPSGAAWNVRQVVFRVGLIGGFTYGLLSTAGSESDHGVWGEIVGMTAMGALSGSVIGVLLEEASASARTLYKRPGGAAPAVRFEPVLTPGSAAAHVAVRW